MAAFGCTHCNNFGCLGLEMEVLLHFFGSHDHESLDAMSQYGTDKNTSERGCVLLQYCLHFVPLKCMTAWCCSKDIALKARSNMTYIFDLSAVGRSDSWYWSPLLM